MFEVIRTRQKEKEKHLENLEKALKKAQSKVDEIENKLNKAINDGNMDEYQILITEKCNLELFCEKTNLKISEIKGIAAHTDADLEQIKLDLQKKYNKKLKSGHEKLRTALENTVKMYKEYQEISIEFANERADFNALNTEIKSYISLYDGENKISNDDIISYKPIIEKINTVLRNTIVE